MLMPGIICVLSCRITGNKGRGSDREMEGGREGVSFTRGSREVGSVRKSGQIIEISQIEGEKKRQ